MCVSVPGLRTPLTINRLPPLNVLELLCKAGLSLLFNRPGEKLARNNAGGAAYSHARCEWPGAQQDKHCKPPCLSVCADEFSRMPPPARTGRGLELR